ncbi:MAG TPA: hypothetical protein VGX03_34710 [Candidatus Binatia bacterium]|jgi:hypothetical protein|nr:hypothetical protein [Candidatus Binatia bacterium]
MAVKGMYDTVRQVFQDIIAPQIEGLKGEIMALHTKVDTLEKRMDERLGSLEKRMEEGFAAVRTEISYTNRRLDEALEIRERLAALEAKVAAH